MTPAALNKRQRNALEKLRDYDRVGDDVPIHVVRELLAALDEVSPTEGEGEKTVRVRKYDVIDDEEYEIPYCENCKRLREVPLNYSKGKQCR